MTKLLIFGTIFLLSSSLFGQISAKDSTVQVIGYWAKQETQSYNVSYEKFKIKSKDTISRELMKYEVDIKIIDSTENSYTIEWFYKNYSIDTENELVRKLTSIANDISVKIKTDEYGAFIEIVNWEEVRDYLAKVTENLKVELKDVPNYKEIIANVMSIYSTKESIEANAIKDALQFYQFHGVKYNLGEELEGILETSNNFGGKPFETDVRFSLDEINEIDGNSIFRSNQVINSKQLTDATYKHLQILGTFGDKIPPRNEFPSLTNETNTASRIHGETGWIIYSIETKEITAEETTNIEERVIEIK
ncbi:hypothetical protein ES692_07005 [Psychroserpens burtonensis]|uniref:Uncharacterized protein n=1 Tax=Psychroserpens burtonensis TaxID=49278 RepID=A0A5C7BA07_9FLAO|nr:hypothetical protein [Psychroserpens burtonensis]TXE18388.1 hypothetical protein ES692_07005 [Psychroserpens burtonensis]